MTSCLLFWMQKRHKIIFLLSKDLLKYGENVAKVQHQPNPCFLYLQKHEHITWEVHRRISQENMIKAIATQNEFMK